MQLKLKTTSNNLPVPVITPANNADPNNISKENLMEKLDSEGIALLRGFNFDTQKLEELTYLICQDFHISATRAKRKVKGDNHTTEVYRDNYALFGHTEGSYRPSHTPPELCFFMCITPPAEKGGETTMVDGIKFLNSLPADIRNLLEKHGITYEMYWEQERWQDEFSVNSIEELKTLLTEWPNVKYELKNNNDLHLFYTTDAISNDRRGNKVFATAMLAHLPKVTNTRYEGVRIYSKPSNKVHFGNGEEIPEEMINRLIDIHDDIMYPHKWQEKDLVVIDNTRWLHGRTMTERNCERVLVSRFGRFKN